MLKSCLCDYSDAYTFLSETTSVMLKGHMMMQKDQIKELKE